MNIFKTETFETLLRGKLLNAKTVNIHLTDAIKCENYYLLNIKNNLFFYNLSSSKDQFLVPLRIFKRLSEIKWSLYVGITEKLGKLYITKIIYKNNKRQL